MYGIASMLFTLPLDVLYAQGNTSSVPDTVYLVDVERRLQQGQLMAIRDLASLWQRQPNNPTCKQIAQKYLLLTPAELDWSTSQVPTQLLQLFYKKEEAWRFSDFLTLFYLTPIEQRPVEAKLKEWQPLVVDVYIAEKVTKSMETALESKNYAALRESILALEGLEQAARDKVAVTLIRNKKFLHIKPMSLRIELLQLLIGALSVEKAIERVLSLAERKAITPILSRNLLANLTNCYFENSPVDSLRGKWEAVLKANKNSLIVTRENAYKQSLPSLPIFFFKPVDYYAWLLATTPKDTLPWIQDNALEDLLATNHPKLLFYLAGLQFRDWRFSSENTYLKILNDLVDVRVAVRDKAGQFTYEYVDPVAQLNFLIYWSQHYEDYEWSEQPVGLYMNRRLKSELVDAYEKHFRRLNSINDSVAYNAFVALTEGIPEEVNRLMKRYRTLLRTYNDQLPPLKFNIIENICHLTHYCRQHHFSYKPTPILLKHLDQLASDLSQKARVQLENQLIHSLTLEELTMVEYYAIVKANNMPLNYSVGRIIDYVYARHWGAILEDEQQLRLFLLKNTLYRKLANFGIARLYHQRIANPSTDLRQLLIDIEQSERNQFIRDAILFTREKEQASTTIEIADFLQDPLAFEDEEIATIDPLSIMEIPAYFQQMYQERNRKILRKMEKYLSTFASVDIVPIIFTYPQEEWLTNKSAAKVIVHLLKDIYGYSFSKNTKTAMERWYQLWESEQATYPEWGKYLFELQLTELTEQEELRIDNINSITKSDYYQPAYRVLCLQALKKLKKKRSITRLELEPTISVSKELKYLEDLDLSYRDLSNFTKILDIDQPKELLTFILRKSTDFPIDEKGFLYNNILRQNWLYHLIDDHQIEKQNVYLLLENLIVYLKESSYLTEFEEHTTQLNILLLSHYQSELSSKLAVLDDLNYSEDVRLKWLIIILARMKYEDISKLLTASKVIETFDKTILYKRLSHDFGLPIFNWEDAKTIATFEQRFQSLSELELYKIYLKEFGIDITNARGKLDFNKIYQLIRFDLVVPFVGEGGQYRDDYVYALIKVLELHFKTTLGFSPKLNEYQTFFQFNSFARVKAWQNYLLAHKHLKDDRNISTSFKRELIEN